MISSDKNMTLDGIIAEIAATDAETVGQCQSVLDLPDWDSLKQIMLLAAIERQLDVQLPMEAFLAAQELSEIRSLVHGKAR